MNSAYVAGREALPGSRGSEVAQTVVNNREVRAGVVAGLAIALGMWVVTLLLGLLPITWLKASMLAGTDELVGDEVILGNSWWIPWSLLSHWGGTVNVKAGGGVSFVDIAGATVTVNYVGLVPLILAVATIWIVGIYVRRLVRPVLRERLVALAVASAVTSFVVAGVAFLSSFTVAETGDYGSESASVVVSFAAGSFLVRSFLLTFLVGSLTFGIAGLVPASHRYALSQAFKCALVPFVVAVVVLPFALGIAFSVISDGESDAMLAGAAVGVGLGPQIAEAVMPMSLGAPLTVGVTAADLGELTDLLSDAPYLGDYLGDVDVNAALQEASHGTVWKYAGLAGTKGRLVALLVVAATLVLWFSLIRRLLLVMGAPTFGIGARNGAVLGLYAGALVCLLSALLTLHAGVSGGIRANEASVSLALGVTGGGLVWTFLALVLSGAAVGGLIAAFRPSQVKFAFAVPRGLERGRTVAYAPGATGATPGRQSEPFVTAATPMAPRRPGLVAFCTSCGAPFSSPATVFCTSCGCPRRSVVTEPQEDSGAGVTESMQPPEAAMPPDVRDEPGPQLDAQAGDRNDDTMLNDMIVAVRQLAQLHEEGLLTEDEFQAKKREILGLT